MTTYDDLGVPITEPSDLYANIVGTLKKSRAEKLKDRSMLLAGIRAEQIDKNAKKTLREFRAEHHDVPSIAIVAGGTSYLSSHLLWKINQEVASFPYIGDFSARLSSVLLNGAAAFGLWKLGGNLPAAIGEGVKLGAVFHTIATISGIGTLAASSNRPNPYDLGTGGFGAFLQQAQTWGRSNTRRTSPPTTPSPTYQ